MNSTNTKKAIDDVKDVINFTDTAINEGLVTPFVTLLKKENSKKKRKFKFLHRKKTNEKRLYESELYESFLENITQYEEFLKSCKYFNQTSIPKIQFLIDNFKKLKNLKKNSTSSSTNSTSSNSNEEFIEYLTKEFNEINKEVSKDLEKLCKQTIQLSDSFHALSMEFSDFQNKLSSRSALIQAIVGITALISGTVILLAAAVFVPIIILPLILLAGLAGSTLLGTFCTVFSTLKLQKRSQNALTLQKASNHAVDHLANIKKSLVEVNLVLENNEDHPIEIKKMKDSQIDYFIQDNLSLIVSMTDFSKRLEESIQHLNKSRAVIAKAVSEFVENNSNHTTSS